MKPGDLAKARYDYNNGYYATKLEQGLQFQDVVTRLLYERGIVVIGYASRRFQQQRGENMLGAEIKRDGQFRDTGNLYIEVAEKSHPDNPNYVPSGIYRGDNSWLFVIGDEATVWILPVKYLRVLESRYVHVDKPTSRGFLIPLADADRYAVKKIDVNANCEIER